ncbi:MAG: glycosyltransferase [bacterium]|nr:glycosyltransferase [bacterium]
MTLEKEQSGEPAQTNAARGDGMHAPGFLDNAGIDSAVLAAAREQAVQNQTHISHVLSSQGILSRDNYVRQLAAHHGLYCVCDVSELAGFEVDHVTDFERRDHRIASDKSGLINLTKNGQFYVALDALHYDEAAMQLFLHSGQVHRDRLLLTTPELKQKLLQSDHETARLNHAVYGLAQKHKGFSARDKTTYGQKIVLSFLFGLLAWGMVLAPISTLYVLGGVLNLLFIYSNLLRLVAVTSLEPVEGPVYPRIEDAELPVYTILVPLFCEHRVVGQLIESLLALDYPRDKLDIKLIFEQEDEETLRAANLCDLPDCFEFVIVPKKMPQTKPKALNFALTNAKGHYVVVYDVEDRPQPDQLRKAVSAFANAQKEQMEGDERPLACLQAGLNHYNPQENWLARQFTIEYTALFDGLLPALQRLDLPMPLGGTSNHFNSQILKEIGGWDAFNVTEDADLGIRLARFGYRCNILHSTTYEEACCRPRDWVRQRTRWLKGWLQTYLVHMRRPRELFKQLGARGFAGFQIILGAQVLSLVIHPVFLAFMIYEASSGKLFNAPYGPIGTLFWTLAIFNFILGYGVAIWLGFATLKQRGYRSLYWHLPFMPLYWLCMSFAAFRALVHYVIKPFHWEKTEHGLGKGSLKSPFKSLGH